MKKKIDLHIHSYYSCDGEYSPWQLVEIAKKEGLFAVISLTDHNTTEEISEALSAGKRYSIEVILGIEIDTSYKGQTFSGEHDIGSKRNKYISMALEPAQIEIMKKIKKALDPNLILNPRKIF